MAVEAPTRGPVRERVVWIDASRAACVLAVVTFHVIDWTFLALPAGAWHPAVQFWTSVNAYLATLRMPLLLAVSGLLAAGGIRAGLGRRKTWVRAWNSYYLYVIWLTVYTVFYAVSTSSLQPHRITGVPDALGQLVVPETPLWYLFALAVYAALLAALHRVPPAVVLTGLVVLSIVSSVVLDDAGLAEKVPHLAIFFALGVYGSDWLRGFATRITPLRIVAAAAAVLLAVLSAKVEVPDWLNAVLFLVRGATFLLLGVALIVTAVHWAPFGRIASSVGRQTLPIYVLHVPLVSILLVLVATSLDGPFATAMAHPAFALGYPVLAMVVITALTLLIHRALRTAGLAFLFDLPEQVRDGLGRAHERLFGPEAEPPPGRAPRP